MATTRGAGAWTFALLLGTGLLLAPGGPPGAAAAPASAVPAAAGYLGGCTGVSSASSYPGALNVTDPYGPAPSTTNRSVEAFYAYQENVTSGGGNRSVLCIPDHVVATTDADGRFTLRPTIPPNSCNAHSCSSFLGPFGPVTFTVRNATPPGDLLRTDLHGTFVAFDWTDALASVEIVPEGAQVLSLDAPTNFTALGLAGDGGGSPAELAVHWVIRGTDWAIRSGANSTTAVVEGSGSPTSGALTLFANGSYNGTDFGFGPFVDALSDAATSVSVGSVTPTSVDEGQPVAVDLSGTGAAGYSYQLTFDPGLNAANVSLGCSSSEPNLQSIVTLRCTGSYTYGVVGTAQPVAELSNGYDAALWSFAAVGVAAPLALSVTPGTLEGYVNTSIAATVTVASGSGTAPYGPACLAAGNGPVNCAGESDGVWTLRTAYADPGIYTAVASVVDGSGVNRSVELPTTIARPPSLGPMSVQNNSVRADQLVNLSDVLVGGLLPASYWWNDSLPNGTVAQGLLGRDGQISLAFSSPVPGLHQLSLTLLDGLGTRIAATTAIEVAPGPVQGLRAVGPAVLPGVAAGSPTLLAVRAVDPVGSTVPGYAAPLTATVVGPSNGSTASWSDASGLIPGSPASQIEIPGTAWSNGLLAINLTLTLAGLWNVTLAGTGVAAGPIVFTVRVHADPADLRLVAPSVAVVGARGNHTLWTVEDAYGNPFLGGYVLVRSVFASISADQDSYILPTSGIGKVWVNVTPLGPSAGVVLVLNPYGAVGAQLLPTIQVPAAPPSSAVTPVTFVAGVGVAAVASVGLALAIRRARRPEPVGPDPDADLERQAAGLDHVRRALSAGPTASFDYLQRGWTGPAPVPDRTELAQWLAALVTEGAVRADAGARGPRVYRLTEGAEPTTGVNLDPAALDRALAGREDDPGEPPG
jgi:hypothetical protein